MVDQSQVLEGEELRSGRRIDSQAGEREHAGAAPLIDRSLDLGRPHQVGLVGRASPVLGDRDVIVRAPDLVLGAVPAAEETNVRSLSKLGGFRSRLFWGVRWIYIPLGEILVAPDMTALAAMGS